jgi:hypothetical protein
VELKFTHPELTEPLVFRSMKEVIAWAVNERDFLADFTSLNTNTSQTYVPLARERLQRVANAAAAEDASDSAVSSLLQTALSGLLVSGGQRGQALTSMKKVGYDAKAIGMTLGAFLNKEEIRTLATNTFFFFDVVIAMSVVTAFEFGGDPQRLATLLTDIEDHKREWAGYIETTTAQTTRSQEANDLGVKQLNESIADAERRVGEVTNKFADDIATIRKNFEQEFALRAPMTYWTEKAGRHRKASTLYRRWFTAILVTGVLALSAVGYWLLFPFMKHSPTPYWVLILFSVLIAVWAWPLRMTSKLYLVHQHLLEDATEREVIVRTFLALNETAKVKLTDDDRKLLLAALVRPAGISLVSDDSGLNVADMIAMKTLMKG